MYYIINWIYGFYRSLRQLLFDSTPSYRNIADVELSKDEYNLDKKTERHIIFALNNIPEIVHEKLFKDYSDVSRNYHQVTFKKNNGVYEPASSQLATLSLDMHNNSIRFVFIRVNLIKSLRKMNHVNCVIVDKRRKFVLYFEPMVVVRIDTVELFDILLKFSDKFIGYNFLVPNDIGYNIYNRLQRYDNYCQTYILYVYCLILENQDVKPNEFSSMFNTVISARNIKCFLYYVHRVLMDGGIDVNNFNSSGLKDQLIDDLVVTEDDEWLVVK